MVEQMTKEQAQKLISKVGWDGLDGAVWLQNDLPDDEFNALVDNYTKAKDELDRYLDRVADEFELHE